MRKTITTMVAIAIAATASAQTVRVQNWRAGQAYRTADGHGAVVTRAIPTMNGQEFLLIVRIVETPAPDKIRWKHGSEFIVNEDEPLRDWRPAHLCQTQLRGYITPDGLTISWETDIYTSFRPCPRVPID